MVIVERVTHHSVVIAADDAAMAMHEFSTGEHDVWHETVDTERVISVVPVPNDSDVVQEEERQHEATGRGSDTTQ